MNRPDPAFPPLPPFLRLSSFRLGVTSYVYPADVLPNVTALAGHADDIELVYFQSRDASNMPTPGEISDLRAIASAHKLTFTVHLPTDRPLGGGSRSERDLALSRMLALMELTAPLSPYAYILHLESISALDGAPRVSEWQRSVLPALARLAAAAPTPAHVSIENLGYPFAWCDMLLEQVPCSICTDAGHLWETGADWRRHLLRYLPRTRVVHLYGPNGSAHQSLAKAPRERTRAFLSALGAFDGVLTLETFGYDDTRTSIEALSALLPDASAGANTPVEGVKADEA